jgi:hemoglobin
MNSTDSLYSRLGGESVLRRYVGLLYDFMDDSPDVEHVRKMHPADLSHARDRLFMFLSGMLGGPPLYMQAFGHPRLRRRHMHFEIGDVERDQWLLCARYAADQLDVAPQARDDLMQELSAMANHLRNKDTTTAPVGLCNAGPDDAKHNNKNASCNNSGSTL